MDSKKLLYIFTSFAVAFILFILGFFALIPKDIEVSQPSPAPEAECFGESCSGSENDNDNIVSLEGVVQVLDDALGQNYGTHQLESEDGEVLAILKTNDDKLKMVEGARVEVHGKILQASAGGFPLIEVEEISFKK